MRTPQELEADRKLASGAGRKELRAAKSNLVWQTMLRVLDLVDTAGRNNLTYPKHCA